MKQSQKVREGESELCQILLSRSSVFSNIKERKGNEGEYNSADISHLSLFFVFIPFFALIVIFFLQQIRQDKINGIRISYSETQERVTLNCMLS
jgi:hypothetical protein